MMQKNAVSLDTAFLFKGWSVLEVQTEAEVDV